MGASVQNDPDCMGMLYDYVCSAEHKSAKGADAMQDDEAAFNADPLIYDDKLVA